MALGPARGTCVPVRLGGRAEVSWAWLEVPQLLNLPLPPEEPPLSCVSSCPLSTGPGLLTRPWTWAQPPLTALHHEVPWPGSPPPPGGPARWGRAGVSGIEGPSCTHGQVL